MSVSPSRSDAGRGPSQDASSERAPSRQASARSPMLRDPMLEVAADPGPLLDQAPGEGEGAAPLPSASIGGLFRYATGADKMLLFFAFLGAIGQGASAPSLAFFLDDLFASIIEPDPDKRHQKVAKSVVTFMLLAAGTFACSLIGFLGFSIVGDRMSGILRRKFFNHLLQKDVGWYDKHSSAEMATRLTNDTYDFRQGVGDKMASFIAGIFMSPLGFVVAFTKSWELTLIMMGTVPILGGSFAVVMKIMAKSSQVQQEMYAQAGGIAETTISSVRTVAAFTGFEREIARYDAKLVEAETRGIQAGNSMGLAQAVAALVMYGTLALGFWGGAKLVIGDLKGGCHLGAGVERYFDNCFTGPTMISTVFAVLYGGIGLALAAPGMATLTTAKAAAARIYDIIDQPPAFDANAGEEMQDVRGSIKFEDVVFSYPTRLETRALDQISFEVKAGTTAAFVGPSGSGKSTGISLLQRFYDPDQGSVYLDGHDIKTLKLTWLRKQMALVQQEPVLLGGSILENIRYGRAGASDNDVVNAAKAANADTFINAFPDKYETAVGERGAQLSGGQKQRIAIARAMIRDPKVLLLDEATSALDNESERIVQKALDDLLLEKTRTTLLIAHRLSTVRNADVIYVMESGHLIESGSHKELMNQQGSLYAQLVSLQEIAGPDDDVGMTDLFRQVSQGSLEGLSPKATSAIASFSRQNSLSEATDMGVTSDLVTRSASRRLSGSAAVARQTSHTSLVEEGKASATMQERREAPEEDDNDAQVPTARLWRLQRPEMLVVAVALLATIPVGAGRPFLGRLFSDSITKFQMPPPVNMTTGKYVALDTAEMNDYIDGLENAALVNAECFIALGTLMFFCTFLQFACFRKAAEKLTRRIREMTFRAMLRQEMAWFDVRTSGHLADRLASEAPLIKSFTGESLAGVVQLFMTVTAGLGLAFYASWQLTLASFVFLPLLSVGSMARFAAMKQKNETEAGPMVSEAMGNVKTVAAFSLERQILQRYDMLLSAEGAKEKKKSRFMAIAGAYDSSMAFLVFGCVIALASFFIDQGWMKSDKVLAVLMPILMCAGGLAVASQWLGDKEKGKKAINHIFSTLDRTPAIDAYQASGDLIDPVKGEIKFEHVAFRYPSRPDIAIFVDFDLVIKPNTTVAFCGPSGSGKSTTISLLQRFYDPEAGRVCLDGCNIKDLNLTWLRKQMSLVQQEPILFGGTIMYNIRYGLESASDDACIEASKSANAHGFITTFPDAYETEVGDRGGKLSGGQKQRIAIARSMIRDPRVLLLDEATSALDTESEHVVQEALDRLLEQSARTTLVIAHRLSTIVNSDIICVIYQGKIIEQGTHAELMKLGGHYKQLATRQDKS